MLRLLRTYLRPAAPLLLGVLVFQAAQSMLTLYLPRISAEIINFGVIPHNDHYIWSRGELMMAVTVLQVFCAIASIYFASRVAMGSGRDIRRDLFHRVTDFSAQEVGQFGAPSLITRITNDVQQVQIMVQMACTMAVTAPIMAIGGTALAVAQAPSLSWILAVCVPALLLTVGLIMSRMTPRFRAMQDQIDVVNLVLREQVVGVRVVRAFVRELVETRRFDRANTALTATGLSTGRMMALMFPLVTFVVNVSSVAVLRLGGSRIDVHQLSIGSLVAFLSYVTQILMAVMMATFTAIMLPRAAVSGGRIQEVLNTRSSLLVPVAAVADVAVSGQLEMRSVGFRYPGADAPVLSGISFVTKPGQTTAVIGSTGAGKTTLVNLVPRLFDATSGTVLVGGVDVRELDPDALWSRVGLVPQKPYLFSGTVASNLRYGKPDASEDEMWEALAVAQAADFVRAMPGGLAAEISQGGANVSGGQRQRLAIARALVHRPDIYLFDDSFSALDLATDARLRAALLPYTAEATRLIVAQRISTIVDADQIVVLDNGRTVGIGTHQELLSNCPTYREIAESQRAVQEAA